MAQMGCFVPAEMAVIPVRDSLLSRIGTGDDMENNVSTFLMEMREVAQVRACVRPRPVLHTCVQCTGVSCVGKDSIKFDELLFVDRQEFMRRSENGRLKRVVHGGKGGRGYLSSDMGAAYYVSWVPGT